jgi:Tol biopolymer transport system component
MLALAFAGALACGHSPGKCSDPEAEASGIKWDRLSGRIAYARWEINGYPGNETHGCIYLVDVPARRVQVLRDFKTVMDNWKGQVGSAKDLAFRGDGSSLTFAVQDLNERWQLHDLSFTTRQESVLFADPNAHLFAPAWSPDGRLAYISNGLVSDVYVNDKSVLSYAAPSRVGWVSTSVLIASIRDAGSEGTLYSVDLQKNSMTPIVSGYAAAPAVDSGTHRVVYEHADSGGWSIWIANLDGTKQTRLTQGVSDSDPAWSADGKSVLFSRSGQGLFLYELVTGVLTQVMVTQRPVDSMVWAP